MCRICGRTIKCFFENMPSRTIRSHHVPSRRAFSTIRRLPTTTTTTPLTASSPILRRNQPPLSLSRSFASLSVSSSATRISPSHRASLPPSLPSRTSPLTPSPSSSLLRTSFPTTSFRTSLTPSTRRSFSTTPAALGYRRRMDTYSPSRRVQKRRHGYLARLKTKGGQAVLKRRQLKGRKILSW